MKFIILHGTGATPESNWFEWLKAELEQGGHEVWLPQLPDCDKPNASTYISFLTGNTAPFQIDNDTVLIGHSSGAVAILHLLQQLSTNIRPKGTILVSAFIDDLGWEALAGLFEDTLDFNKIRNSCEQIIIIHSDDDPYVPLRHAQQLSELIRGKLHVIPSQGHFNTEQSPEYARFPLLMNIVESLVSPR